MRSRYFCGNYLVLYILEIKSFPEHYFYFHCFHLDTFWNISFDRGKSPYNYSNVFNDYFPTFNKQGKILFKKGTKITEGMLTNVPIKSADGIQVSNENINPNSIINSIFTDPEIDLVTRVKKNKIIFYAYSKFKISS